MVIHTHSNDLTETGEMSANRHCIMLVHMEWTHRANCWVLGTTPANVATMFECIGTVQPVHWNNILQTFVQCPWALAKHWLHTQVLHCWKYHLKNANLTKLNFKWHGTNLNFWLDWTIFTGQKLCTNGHSKHVDQCQQCKHTGPWHQAFGTCLKKHWPSFWAKKCALGTPLSQTSRPAQCEIWVFAVIINPLEVLMWSKINFCHNLKHHLEPTIKILMWPFSSKVFVHFHCTKKSFWQKILTVNMRIFIGGSRSFQWLFWWT